MARAWLLHDTNQMETDVCGLIDIYGMIVDIFVAVSDDVATYFSFQLVVV